VALDVQQLRQEFPQLARREGGQEFAYLDSAATSQKPRAVIQAVSRIYEAANANVHRGLYGLAEEATAAFEQARDRVASYTGAYNRRGVVFTRNCTEAINLVAHAWGRARLGPGDELLLTAQEHHSNLVPWQLCARATGARLRFIPLDDAGSPRLETLADLLSERTRLVALSGMSNVLGRRNALSQAVAAARAAGARVLVDGAQLVMHGPVDLAGLGADFFAFSGHKVMGPTGVGALVARPELLEEMEPFLAGGEMVLDVTLEGATYNEVPYKFEAGTPPVAEAVGLGEALAFVETLDQEAVARHEAALVARGLELLGQTEGVTLYGPGVEPGRAPTFAFNLFGADGQLIHPHDVGQLLANEGIAIRAGHHCAKPLMRHFGVPAMCRASAYIYNTELELERLAGALGRVRRFFCGG